MDTKLLLSQVNQIAKKYDEIYKSTGGYFNIFSITHIEADEVVICRVIKELLDPKGSHYQGAVYLQLFMEYVLEQTDFDIDELQKAVVEREKLIEGNRRIDLFIKVPDKLEIPIEVKIYAGDQPSQCFDYYKYAYNSKLYYLTLDGHMPSENSLATLDSTLVKPISFRKDIIDWLMKCLKLTETVRIAPIREVILQLIDALRKLTNQAEDKMEKEILSIVMESKASFKNAELIMSAVKEAEQVMYDKYFRRLNECICEKYPNLVDWTEDLEEEYNQYGIYYVVKNLKDGNKLCLEIACEQTMYAGFTVCDSNEEGVKCKGYISQEDLMTGKWQSSDMWIAWKYMGHDMEERPNFKHHNDAFYSLLEEDGFNQFIEKSMDTIEELMGSLI